MYPLNVSLPELLVGFARANDESEHIALTAAGYVPAFVAPEKADLDRAALLAEAEKRGVKVDKRWAAERIAEELAKA